MKIQSIYAFYILSLFVIFTSCSSSKPTVTNKTTPQISGIKTNLPPKEDTKIETSNSINLPISDTFTNYKDTLSNKTPFVLQNGVSTEWIGSENYNLRKPNFVIIHHTAQDSIAQTIKTFTMTKTQVSSHYVIGEDGRVVQMVNDYFRAWHGGSAQWGKNTDLNSASIGIELDNNGFEPFSEKQIISLISLLTRLKKKYNIPTHNIIGHSDISPSRKKDPSAYFPWKLLAINGLGIWPDEILEPAPENFNVELALRIIGYNTTNLNSAIYAFKLHYIQTEADSILDEKTKNTIYNIFKKQ